MSANILVVTDGASKGNPGPAGYAARVGEKLVKGWHPWLTNNEAEAMALLVGLMNAPCGARLTIWSDSSYLRDWVRYKTVPQIQNSYLRNLVKAIRKVAILHQFEPWPGDEDLIPVLYDPMTRVYRGQFLLVKGHSDNWLHNEIDRLASAQAMQAKLAGLGRI